ncbi:hypothetical protein GCM10009864_15270 [Streptomyces lunalinharesii]|uniref:Secreted protein n=1 Tax=Streptomyces lunalinharesii TaxID=333384 RepID=A0ABN3RG75_9ACTN
MSALLSPALPHPASAVMPAAAASAAAVILLVVLTDFLLAGQEETRPRPVPAALRSSSETFGSGRWAGRNSMSDDRTSYPE